MRIETAILKKYIKGKYIRSYHIDYSENETTIFPYNETASLIQSQSLAKNYPNSWKYFNDPINKKILIARESGRFAKQWWAYSRPQNMKIIFTQKILTPFNAFKPSFAIDNKADFVFSAGVSGAYGILLKPEVHLKYEYLVGLLNSRLLFFVIKNISTSLRGSFYSFENKYLQKLPIRPINFSDPEDKARHDRIVKLVEHMLAAKEQRAAAKTEKDENKLDHHIAALDRQIDEAVYELYGLTEEEIKIVEGE